jgi:aerobic C4-dicarboxylate transport protein
MARPGIFRHLYFYVVVAIFLGAFVGYCFPAVGVQLKPLGDAFLKLIRMCVPPIIFTTVAIGIAGLGRMQRVGRVGIKALIYFEALTTVALVIGYVVVKLAQPGVGMNVDPKTLDASAIKSYASVAPPHSWVEFFLAVIPVSIVDAFAKGEIIQVIFFSVLFGFALSAMGEARQPLVNLLEQISDAMMKIIGLVVKLAPVAAFGAIAYTVASLGIDSLAAQAKLMLCVYLTCLLFIVIVLGLLLRICGVSLWRFLRFIREEILIVLGTSSSESVLPSIMTRLEQLGCSRPVVRMVLPAGYSFNMDGSCIYLTMAAIFIAQATNCRLTISQELTVIVVCLLTSKGAGGVSGAGFIALAATLSSFPAIPVEGMILIFGIDRLMSEARAITNLIGNGVATIVIAAWEGEFDRHRCALVLARDSSSEEHIPPPGN